MHRVAIDFLKSFSGDARDRLVFDTHEGAPIVRTHATGVTLTSTAGGDGAGRDTSIFSETVGHDASQIEAEIAAGVAHPAVHVAGHAPVIDPGHDASALTGVASLTADHLLLI